MRRVLESISGAFLLFLTFLMGPLVAFIGHVTVCHDIDISSKVMACASGDRVSDVWLYVGAVTSILPFVLLVLKYTGKPLCDFDDLSGELCNSRNNTNKP